MKSKKMGHMKDSGWVSGSHTSDSKAPPGDPKMDDSWPEQQSGPGLTKDKKSGKNRDRGSFKGGHAW